MENNRSEVFMKIMKITADYAGALEALRLEYDNMENHFNMGLEDIASLMIGKVLMDIHTTTVACIHEPQMLTTFYEMVQKFDNLSGIKNRTMMEVVNRLKNHPEQLESQLDYLNKLGFKISMEEFKSILERATA